MVADSGLRVSSLCRGGFFTAPTARRGARARRQPARDRRDGGARRRRRARLRARARARRGRAARRRSATCPAPAAGCADAIGELGAVRRARAGVALAIEPMHPMYAADRAVVSTLGQALDLAEQFPPRAVGVVVDTFHVWWDPQLAEQIARAGRAAGSRATRSATGSPRCPPTRCSRRGMMGDGHIDFRRVTRRGRRRPATTGDIEVEIFNADLGRRPAGGRAAHGQGVRGLRRPLKMLELAVDRGEPLALGSWP